MEFLDSYDNIILFGADHGHDMYGIVPLYWDLIAKGKKVEIINIGYTDETNKMSSSSVIEVKPNSNKKRSSDNYCPELDLANFLNCSVYAITETLQSISSVTRALLSFLNCIKGTKALVLIDNGHDVMLFGNDNDLNRGDPTHDTFAAVVVNNIAETKMADVYAACVSAPTDNMNFTLFKQQYEMVKGKYPLVPANVNYIKQYEKLLNTTSLSFRSIPSEGILAGMQLINGTDPLLVQTKFVLRLTQIASNNEWDYTEFPLTDKDAAVYMFFDFHLLMAKSPYYQFILANCNDKLTMSGLHDLTHKALKACR